MDYKIKILFFILSTLTATFATESTDTCTKYDITTVLNNSFTKTFENMDKDIMEELILSMYPANSTNLETEIVYEIKPFQNRFYFTGINTTLMNSGPAKIRHEFSSDETIIFNPMIILRIEGYLGPSKNMIHYSFKRSLGFENISIIAIKSQDDLSKSRFQIDISYDNFASEYIYNPGFYQDIRSESAGELEEKVIQLLPSLFHESLQDNKNFLRMLDKIACAHPEKEIASFYPDFVNNKEKYYYLAPDIPLIDHTLMSNITIRGLSNFRSHSFSSEWDHCSSTLTIGSIRGNANLLYGSHNSTIFPLQFEADHVTIFVDQKNQRYSINLHNYSVTAANVNVSLTKYQSKWVIEGIQLAIASAIIPSMKTKCSTQRTDACTKYDITTILTSSFTKTFENMDIEMMEELILSIDHQNSTNFETEIVFYEIEPFQNRFYFTGINITLMDLASVQIRHQFSPNKMIIFFPKLILKIEGYLGASKNMVHVGFKRSLDFENISIIAIKWQDNLSSSRFQIDILYDDFESTYIYTPWFHQDIGLHSVYELERKIKQLLPSLFHESLQDNKNFLRMLDKTVCDNAEKEIAYFYPDFVNHKEEYYYLAPNITSLDRTLSNIKIRGLSSFRSHSFSAEFDQCNSTLTIGNIRGNANLHYGSLNYTIFPLQFEADRVTILVDQEKQRVSVDMYNYSVSQANINVSLTEYQSKWVMEGIQLAIASAITPSMKTERRNKELSNTNVDHPLVKILKMATTISHQFKISTEKAYDHWFTTKLHDNRMESSLRIDSCIYNLSIGIVRNAFPFWSLYSSPNLIRCDLYNNLTISFGVETSLYTIKANLINATHKFYFEFYWYQFAADLIKRNNTNDSEDYEWIIRRDFELEEITLSQYNFTQHQNNALVEKIKETLKSKIKEQHLLYAKSLPESVFNQCVKPVKIFDDFLPFYADYELPYCISNDNCSKTEECFASKINNVTITKWDATPICFEINLNDIDSDNEVIHVRIISSAKIKIHMNFNDSSVQLKTLELDASEIVLCIEENAAKINTGLVYQNIITDVDRSNGSISQRDIVWIVSKLENVIAKSFMKANMLGQNKKFVYFVN